MQNRDYFTKPIQHSRGSHDYGRSGPIEPMHPNVGIWWNSLGVIIGGFVLALMFFAWIS